MGMGAWERSKRAERANRAKLAGFKDRKSAKARQVESGSESESDPWRSEGCRGRDGS
jgi:hypothetical protein